MKIRFKLFFCLFGLPLFWSYSLAQYDLSPKTIKLSLGLTGKLPEEEEIAYFESLVQKDSKKALIDSCLQKMAFYKMIEAKLREDILEGTSTAYLYEQAKDYYFLYSTRENSIFHEQFEAHFRSLDYLGKISLGHFTPEAIEIESIYKNIFLTPIYDKINMGSVNFVTSSFQHLLGRKPTNTELSQGVRIVEGQYAHLFNSPGTSKEDYLDILISNPEFMEHQIHYWYLHLFNDAISSDYLLQLLIEKPANIHETIRTLASKLWDEY